MCCVNMDSVSPIGKGDGGDSDGTLVLGDNMAVIAGDSEENVKTVPTSDRVSATRRDGIRCVIIGVCPHEGSKVIDQGSQHLVMDGCTYCNLHEGELEDHVFDTETQICICGHRAYKVAVSSTEDVGAYCAVPDTDERMEFVPSGERFDIVVPPDKDGIFLVPSAEYYREDIHRKAILEYSDFTVRDWKRVYHYVMPYSDVNVSVGPVMESWAGLQAKISGVTNRSTIKLTQNITVLDTDKALVVPEGKEITIDLNGYTLSRGLTAAREDGSVLINNGILTIRDGMGSGKITGGNTTGGGGGIVNNNMLTLSSGSITGNYGQMAGGVLNNEDGTFLMNGGEISDNTCGNGGGGGIVNYGNFNCILGSITGNRSGNNGGGIWNKGTLTIKDVRITGNSAQDKGGGVYARGESHLFMSFAPVIVHNTTDNRGTNNFHCNRDSGWIASILAESISNGLRVGLSCTEDPTLSTPIRLVRTAYGTVLCNGFFSDLPYYEIEEVVEQNIDHFGYLSVGTGYTITLNPGTGAEPDIIRSAHRLMWTGEPGKFFTDEENDFFVIPDVPPMFRAPEGLSFGGWKIEGDPTVYKPGLQMLQLEKKEYTLTAIWEKHYRVYWEPVPADTGRWPNNHETFAAEGESVPVFLYLGKLDWSKGLRLKSLTITGEGMEPIIITKDSSGQELWKIDPDVDDDMMYSMNFTMPAQAVTVTSQFIRDLPIESTVQLVWDDHENELGKRPETVSIWLFDRDNSIKVFSLSEEGGWKATETELHTAVRGEEAVYSWGFAEGELPPGYDLTGNVTEGSVTTLTLKYKETTPRYAGHRLRLTGAMGMMYYLIVPDDFNPEGAYMSFAVGGKTQIVPWSESRQVTLADREYQIFECTVFSYQMAEPIRAEFNWRDGDPVTEDYSVEAYLKSVRDEQFTAKSQELADAALAYGHFIQPYLYDQVGIHYADIAYSGSVNVSAAESGTANYPFTVNTINTEKLSGFDFYLSANNSTDLVVRIYLKSGVTGAVTGSVNGATVQPGYQNGAYVLTVSNIAANNYDVNYAFEIQLDGQEVFSFNASVLSYIHRVLSTSTDENERNALAAMYSFYTKAEDYQQ